METYEQRPISMYDNLNNTPSGGAGPLMHTSTPKSNKTAYSSRQPATAADATMATTPTVRAAAQPTTYAAANGATSSQQQQQPPHATTPHYADLAFKFDDATTAVQQRQQRQQQQSMPPSSVNANQNHRQQSESNSNSVNYATLFKPAASNSTPAPQPQQPVAVVGAATTNVTPAATAAAATAAASAAASAAAANASSPALGATAYQQQQRPLSQHSQSELNETSRQNIAAAKAALNDAKSKFFGLNGYATVTANNEDTAAADIYQTPPTPAPPFAGNWKPQPKYQNIPTNSAIYRCQREPPELPPKPSPPSSSRHNSPSPVRVPSPSRNMSSTPPGRDASPGGMSHQHSPSPQPSKILPYNATYQQVPLNDIETTQPSQAVYMSTTVPQNIKASKIAGRHTPTRNSLRHSRMLVVNNKSYREFQHPNPMNFKYPNVARSLLILQIVVGLLIGCLAIWICFLAPSTAVQDNPYWSGLALLLAGLIGLVLVRYQRIKRHKVREHCFLFLRADSYLLALLAVVLCCVALICASIHHMRLTASDTHCESTNPLLEHGSCLCTFNAPPTASQANASDLRAAGDDEEERELLDRSYKFEYRDLSCQEVSCDWTYMLVLSIILNTFGLIVSVLYIVLLACYRRSAKRLYASVHTSTF